MIKATIKKLLPKLILEILRKNTALSIQKLELVKWIVYNRPLPPPHIVKQRTVKKFQKKYSVQTLIETGTFYGDMVYAMRNRFKKIYSIELSEYFYEFNVKKFKQYNNIKILHGDSSKELIKVVKNLDQPTLFWLDGHYSAGNTAKGESNCPVLKEIDAIMGNDLGHIILIDDARDFRGKNEYPSIEEVKQKILSFNRNYVVEVKNDIIRAYIK